MGTHKVFNLTAAALLSFTLLSGCATSDSYTQAFTHTSAPAGNGHHVNADLNRAFKATRAVLVQQGFAIQSMDSNLGVIKASRDVQDLRNKDMTYNIVATIDITNTDANDSIISIAANQRSILHTVSHDWWHLLFIFPIFPTGTHYENVVINEGEVIDPLFYKGFFDGLNRNLELMPAPAPAPVPVVVIAPAPTPTPPPAPAPVTVVETTIGASATTASSTTVSSTLPVVTFTPITSNNSDATVSATTSKTSVNVKSTDAEKKSKEESPAGSVISSITTSAKVN